MTSVLLITNSKDFTTDYVVRSLNKLGADYYRLNTDEIGDIVFLTFDFVHNDYTIWDKPKELKLNILSYKSVYFRRPEIPIIEGDDVSQEEKQFIRFEIHQTLEGLYKILRDAYWISDVDSIRRAENKIFQQILAKEIGFRIAEGIVTNDEGQFQSFVRDNNNDCIVKPILSGQIGWPVMKKVVFTNMLIEMPTREQIEYCPSYIQKRIEKKYDIRVTVVEDEIFAVRIFSQNNIETKIDWRAGEKVLHHEAFILPENLTKQCKELVRRLNLRFGAIDFIETIEGDFVFLEINPNGQWAWIETQTGMPISETIANKLLYGNNT